jgi:hypothetical protein
VLARPQNDPVDGVLVEPKQPGRGPDANAFGRVVNDLTDYLCRQVHSEQGTGACSGKTLAAGSAVQQIAALVLAVLAADTDVALPSQAVIFALLVGTKALFELGHGLPPDVSYELHGASVTQSRSNVN